MSPQIDDRTLFQATLASVAQQGWADIDEYYSACIEAGCFGTEFQKQAAEVAAKDAIRRELRSGRITDDRGNVVRVASITIKDSEGRKRKVYKDEMLFDVGDCVQVVRYWRDCRNVCEKRIRYYVKLAIRLHGSQVESLLPLTDPDTGGPIQG